MSRKTQRVKFRNTISTDVSVLHGVPQGTVLRPVVSLIYSNDIADVISFCHIKFFADDTMIYSLGFN